MGAGHIDRHYDLAAIKRAVSVVAVVNADEPLVQRNERLWVGKNHDSLQVEPGKGLWHWWKQGQGGDIFTWLMWRRDYGWHESVRCAIEFQTSGSYAPLHVVTGHVSDGSQSPKTAPRLPTAGEATFYHECLLGRPDLQARLAVERGLDRDEIERWQIGYRLDHWGGGEAWSIPVYDGGKLLNIRYRIWNPSGYWAKYLPHGKGLGIQLYNADVLSEVKEIIIVEGEFKAIALERFGLPAIGLMGCESFKRDWLPRFAHLKRCWVMMDDGIHAPDLKWARALAAQCECLAVTLPGKPDDLLRSVGNASIITSALPSARRINP